MCSVDVLPSADVETGGVQGRDQRPGELRPQVRPSALLIVSVLIPSRFEVAMIEARFPPSDSESTQIHSRAWRTDLAQPRVRSPEGAGIGVVVVPIGAVPVVVVPVGVVPVGVVVVPVGVVVAPVGEVCVVRPPPPDPGPLALAPAANGPEIAVAKPISAAASTSSA